MRRISPPVLLVLLFCAASHVLSGQHLRYGLNFSFNSIQHNYPVEGTRYYNVSLKPVMATKLGASVAFEYRSFRLGTGLQYMSVESKQDGGYIKTGSMAGNAQFQVANKFLIFPVDFQLLLSTKWKVKPVVQAGLNIFKVMETSYSIHIVPDEAHSHLPIVGGGTEDKRRSRFHGARVGAGAAISPFGNHEFAVLLFRNFNKSRYSLTDANKAKYEKHEISFNAWEVALAWTMR